MIREKGKQKKNKEHFIHISPKLKAAREFGDYRALYSDTIPDRYPLPHIQDYVSSLHGMKIFSTIDLVCAYTRRA